MKHFSRLAALGGLIAAASGWSVTPKAQAVGTPLAPPAVYAPGVWQGKGTAVVRVLDRLDAHVEVLTIPAGTTAHYKSLDLTAGRCLERPKTLSPDAAGWLELHDTHPDGATFKGWMLAAEPGLGVFESAVYDVRMVRCEGADVAPMAPPLPTPAAPVLAPSGGDKPASDATRAGSSAPPAGDTPPATPESGGEY
ncbi:hypothetical protein AD949_05410 [Acetobacter orleanensis]|nr:hypothetical protein AD949_05410 [Acetobacter orleanensis]PCD78911.1 DUF2155 domain-containing protein [Acetobacter orleanensis]